MISVNQGNARMPVTALTETDGIVHLETGRVGGTFDRRLSADGSEIDPTWKQGASTSPLDFKRLEKAPNFSRPREPKWPYPCDEEEVAFENTAANLKRAGTLTKPRGAGPQPAVVLVSGEKDLPVAAKWNLDTIATALNDGGNTGVKTGAFPGLNQLFQTCTTGAIAGCGTIAETFNLAALAVISDWIRQQTGLH